MNLLEILSCGLRIIDNLSSNHQGTACLAPCKCIIINIAFLLERILKLMDFIGMNSENNAFRPCCHLVIFLLTTCLKPM